MGFWSGFAQGWENESERIERRKLFQQELNEKRVGTLAELVTRMGRTRAFGGGSTGDDATPTASAEHYTQVLAARGMSPDDIAKLNAKGGVFGLKAAVDVIEEYNTPENPLTPEHLKRIPDSIIVTQQEVGEQVDPKTIAEQIWGPDFWAGLDPADQQILELQSQQAAPGPSVTSTFTPEEPFRQETANQVVSAATETLMVDLVDKEEELQTQLANAADEEQKAIVAEQLARVASAKSALENGNIAPGIQIAGVDVIGPFLENNPRLKDNPGLLGPWKNAAEAYINGGVDQTQEALAPEPTNVPRVGEVIDGYRYLGGDPSLESSWELVNG